MLEVRIHGYGGQGSVTLAQLLAQAALNNGSQSQALPFFGMERRGTPVRAVVRISDEVIRIHSQHSVADLVILMKGELYEIALEAGVKPGVLFIINTRHEISCDNPAIFLNASAIAEENGLGTAAAAINVPLYAAACKVLGISEEIMVQTLSDKWQGAIGAKNMKAAQIAYKAAELTGGKNQ